MSDSFANEFEKWLEKKTGETNCNKEEEEESLEENDNDSEYILDTADNDESEPEKKYREQLSDKRSKLIAMSISDQAPILVDDDDDCDDVFSKEKQQFEDEPPILEPAPRQVQECKMTKLGIPHLFSQNSFCNYNRLIQYDEYEKSSLQKHKYLKTYSSKHRVKHSSETYNDCNHKHLSKLKDIESGNIFDKFKSDSYEHFPPPLIPCPEVLQLHSESPKTEYRHPSHSPDFCAMEADSTSEIAGDKAGSLFYSRRLSKNSVHGEVSVECDSTCMLAASPMIVSPASVSNGEIDEVRDTEGGKNNCDMQNNDLDSQNFDDLCTEVRNELHINMQEPAALICDVMNENDVTLDFHHSDSTQWTEKNQPHCSKSPTISAFSHIVPAEIESNCSCDFPNEPPTLSVITPPLMSHCIYRKKHHTIDSSEDFLKSRKRHYVKYSPQLVVGKAEFDVSTPPKLTHISQSVFTLGKHSKRVLQKELQNVPEKFILPLGSLLENSSSLSQDLLNFVSTMSQLSQLQTRMHMLLYQLFPQLRTELDAMSPESPWFSNLLSDLIRLLEQPCLQIEVQDLPISPHFINQDDKHNSSSENPLSGVSKMDYICQNTTNKSSSHDFQAANSVRYVSSSNSICSFAQPVKSNYTRQYYTKKRHFHLMKKQNKSWDHESDLVIPHLSQMTLTDVEEIIKPSKVLLYRNPDRLLNKFVELSCRVLQLLLPDLNFILHIEFAEFPHDLAIFIDNVIHTNSKQRSKH